MKERIKILLEKILKEVEPKNKWVKISGSQRKDYAKNLLDLINNSYKEIGGHFKVKDISDIINNSEYDVWYGIDLDNDDDFEATSFGKSTPSGIKSGGMGQDGSSEAKKNVLDYKSKELHKKGYYSEMSGKISEIMLMKYNCPYVNNQEKVEKILGKKVEWFGEHPKGLCPGKNGWYKRKVAGHEEYKIMVGMPK